MNLHDFHSYLNHISNRGVKPSLERIGAAVRLLHHPQEAYKIIHVAGTNAKGSVCSFVAHLLAVSGYKVGLALSPHVYDYRERIQISGNSRLNLILETDLLHLHAKLLTIIPDSLGLTYFEWGVLLALQYFKEQRVDFAVVETGLGGRWDATNICPSIISAITTIDYDHMEYLGDTREKILTEKLQIIKENSDFLFGPDDKNLVNMAHEHCQKMGARFFGFGMEVRDVAFKVEDSEVHQDSYLESNLRFALCLGRILARRDHPIDEQAFLKSYRVAIPPARLEVVRRDPLILIDGAHNEQGLTTLKKYLTHHYQDDYDVVFGCLKTRDFCALARIIKSPHRNFWARFDGDHRTTSFDTYQQVERELGGEVVELDAAFRVRLLDQKITRPIIVCGSFYLCSQFKEWL